MAKIAYFECARCAEHLETGQLPTACPHCSGTLLARYELSPPENCEGKASPAGEPQATASRKTDLPKRRSLGGIIQPY
jgi:hypothetical protein